LALWVIGDLHLSFGEDKPMEVFGGWDNYTERLRKNWCNLVSQDDTVVIAGDVSWAMKLENTLEDFRFIHSLPGRKIILKGNHDYWWTTVKKMEAFLSENELSSISFLLNNSFTEGDIAICGTKGIPSDSSETEEKIINREAGRLKMSIESAKNHGGEKVAFVHYPPIYGEYVSERIVDVLLEYGVKRCYYGHLHGYAKHRAFNGEYRGIKFRLISCDSVNFSPVPVTD
jgi:predicted phosphohydrolase